jgi:hypothetical protein
MKSRRKLRAEEKNRLPIARIMALRWGRREAICGKFSPHLGPLRGEKNDPLTLPSPPSSGERVLESDKLLPLSYF